MMYFNFMKKTQNGNLDLFISIVKFKTKLKSLKTKSTSKQRPTILLFSYTLTKAQVYTLVKLNSMNYDTQRNHQRYDGYMIIKLSFCWIHPNCTCIWLDLTHPRLQFWKINETNKKKSNHTFHVLSPLKRK